MEPQEQPQEKINPFRESPQAAEKINPFKELPKPKQPQVTSKEKHKEKPQEKSQAKEITIKLRPWKMVKGLFIIVLFLGVFYAGRFTAGAEGVALPNFSKYFTQDAGPSGLVTGETEPEEQEPEASQEAAPLEVVAAQNDSEETTLAEAEVPEAAEKVEETEKKPETFVDEEYSLVTLSLDGVYKDWKGTWGKIKGVKYTITNNEKGTIRPHHFTMIVEGYEDGEKYFDVGIASQRVKSEQTLSDEAAVSGGFAYSAVTIPDGDLKKVRVSLFLQDANSETIASVHQEVDLSGE